MSSIRGILTSGNIAYVPLTLGYTAIVDADVVKKISAWNWRADVRIGTIYASRHIKSCGKTDACDKLLHRVILDAKKGEIVDHINGNGLDNRMENLRIVTVAENKKNIQFSSTGNAEIVKKIGDCHVSISGHIPSGSHVSLSEWMHLTGRNGVWLARVLNVTPNTITQWRRGHNLPIMPYRREIERITEGAVPADAWK